MKLLKAVDLYCGAGGTTTGAIASGRVHVAYAINHWRTAIYTHQNNHPATHHICAPIDHVDPREFEREGIDLILASPECTHHSIARGGRPVEDQKRAGGWDVLKWVEVLKPGNLVVENVREWLNWGPVGKGGKPIKRLKGTLFKAWVSALESLNYRVEWRLLNAADYGEATSRIRLFVIARRNGGKINWPVATHSKANWRAAAEIIDWGKECPSIFSRKKQLADKTLRRIEIGIRKFCSGPDGRPFVVKLRGTGTANDVLEPLPTLTAGGNHNGLAVPFLVSRYGKNPGRVHDVQKPLPTVVAHGSSQLVVPFLMDIHNRRRADNTSSIGRPVPTLVTKPGNSLVTPFMLDVNHGGDDGRTNPVTKPLGTVTVRNGKALALPFLTNYFGTGGVDPVTEPLSTITTKGRHGLAMVSLVKTMKELKIVDVGFRMLDIDELLRAQGFPEGYNLHGTKEEMTKQVGNSVCVRVAKAICESLAA